MIGDRVSAALVGRSGSIDWLCLPRFDSGACFAALLGDSGNGRWLIAPAAATQRATRRYQEGTLILETVFETPSGSVMVTDFMPVGQQNAAVIRVVDGLHGHVDMHTELGLRFDYGMSVPWVTRLHADDTAPDTTAPDKTAAHKTGTHKTGTHKMGTHKMGADGGIVAIAGPDMVVLRTSITLRGEAMRTVGRFTLRAGQRVNFVLSHGKSHLPIPEPVDAAAALAATQSYWREFIARSTYQGPYAAAVHRSLLTLKALSYAPTGGIVAAVTTSLPEQLGGARNWDYRYCWLRDASLTLFALMGAGFTEEAIQWRDWLHRSVAGSAAQIQIMYGLHGERALDERELPWLAGYAGSQPVRIGNAASGQVQLDVYGEVLECLHQTRRQGLRAAPHGWAMQRNIIEHLAEIWDQPDEGMWEIRGGARHFTFSKVMAWVAVDRTIKDATHHHLSGPLESWRALRTRIFDRVMAEGVDHQRGCFVQSFGSSELDASLLLIAPTGFLPTGHPLIAGTVRAVEEDLLVDGFVQRYRTSSHVDGLAGGEGAFLACTFWLVGAYTALGRRAEAVALFERLLGLCNDVGLLSEEYDTRTNRLVGNFPQAFSHVALVAAAMRLRGK